MLTHGDLSKIKILLEKDTFEITGLVDWSLAGVLPFGMELDALRLTTGFMDFSGWHDYECWPRLEVAFWAESWAAACIKDSAKREEVRGIAETAAMIGAVLRYAFAQNPDGSPSETVTTISQRMVCGPAVALIGIF